MPSAKQAARQLSCETATAQRALRHHRPPSPRCPHWMKLLAGAFSWGARGEVPSQAGAFSRGARGGSPRKQEPSAGEREGVPSQAGAFSRGARGGPLAGGSLQPGSARGSPRKQEPSVRACETAGALALEPRGRTRLRRQPDGFPCSTTTGAASRRPGSVCSVHWESPYLPDGARVG